MAATLRDNRRGLQSREAVRNGKSKRIVMARVIQGNKRRL
jgi:hypothetical protein